MRTTFISSLALAAGLSFAAPAFAQDTAATDANATTGFTVGDDDALLFNGEALSENDRSYVDSYCRALASGEAEPIDNVEADEILQGTGESDNDDSAGGTKGEGGSGDESDAGDEDQGIDEETLQAVTDVDLETVTVEQCIEWGLIEEGDVTAPASN